MFLSLKTKKEKELYKSSLAMLGKQITETISKGTWTNASGLKRPINNIVVNGMGGSNLGAHIIVSLLQKELKLPIAIDPGYDVAGYVGKNTAYIVSSYSGTTEEPLVAYTKAKQRGALVIALTAIGENTLSEKARKDRLPLFQFPISANPSNQPRLGVGAALSGLMTVLVALNALPKSSIKELSLAAKKLAKNSKILASSQNPARALAKRMKGKTIAIVSGPLFSGNAQTLRNQFNESAKQSSFFLTVSDMNHHALEGLSFPKSNRKRLSALFIESTLDDQKIQKRINLSQEIFRKNRVSVVTYKLQGKTKLEQGLELLQFGGYLSYYISIINHVDPSKIPFVDWFKKKLSN